MKPNLLKNRFETFWVSLVLRPDYSYIEIGFTSDLFYGSYNILLDSYIKPKDIC